MCLILAVLGFFSVAHAGDGPLLATIPAESAAVVAFSPDGSLVAYAPANEPARVWSLAEGKAVKTFDSDAVVDLLFGADGNLAVARLDNKNRFYGEVWRPADWKKLNRFKGDKGYYRWKFAPYGGKPALWANGVWELDTAKAAVGRVLAGGEEVPIAAQIWRSRDGGTALNIGDSSFDSISIEVWSVPGGKQRSFKIGRRAQVAALSWDGRLAAVDEGEGLDIVLLASGQKLKRLDAKGCYSAEFSRDGLHLACLQRDNFLSIWRVSDGTLEARSKAGSAPDPSDNPKGVPSQYVWPKLTFSPGGDLLAVSALDKSVQVWRWSGLAVSAAAPPASSQEPADAKGLEKRALAYMKEFDFEKAIDKMDEPALL